MEKVTIKFTQNWYLVLDAGQRQRLREKSFHFTKQLEVQWTTVGNLVLHFCCDLTKNWLLVLDTNQRKRLQEKSFSFMKQLEVQWIIVGNLVLLW